MNKWNETYNKVWNDVDWNNVKRSTQNSLKELNAIYRKTELENKLLRNEILRLFDRLCEIVDYNKKFDMDYLDEWLEEQINEKQ